MKAFFTDDLPQEKVEAIDRLVGAALRALAKLDGEFHQTKARPGFDGWNETFDLYEALEMIGAEPKRYCTRPPQRDLNGAWGPAQSIAAN